MLKRIITVTLTLAVVGSAFYAYDVYSARYPSTDNAYIVANVVHIAPQVGGQVAETFVHDQQYVHAGDKLFSLDARPFQLAVDSARAHLEQVRQRVVIQAAAVDSAEAEVKRLEVLADNAAKRADRSRELHDANFVSQQVRDDDEAERRAAEAQLVVARAKLNEAREQLGKTGEGNQAVVEAKAALGAAEWQLSHTALTASCDGRIAQYSLQVGDAVREGQANFVLVCDHDYWVEANFKETEMANIRPGQPVKIAVDMYPSRDFPGVVESINAASGVAFSLLPPQNASGNWVKVTQRVPVKIRVKELDPEHPLLVGTSAHVRIDSTVN